LTQRKIREVLVEYPCYSTGVAGRWPRRVAPVAEVGFALSDHGEHVDQKLCT